MMSDHLRFNQSINQSIDYRKLNSGTVPAAHAILRIYTLHLLVGDLNFPKLDIKCGYWQVELNEDDNLFGKCLLF